MVHCTEADHYWNAAFFQDTANDEQTPCIQKSQVDIIFHTKMDDIFKHSQDIISLLFSEKCCQQHSQHRAKLWIYLMDVDGHDRNSI
jgi:hypothetical protein